MSIYIIHEKNLFYSSLIRCRRQFEGPVVKVIHPPRRMFMTLLNVISSGSARLPIRRYEKMYDLQKMISLDDIYQRLPFIDYNLMVLLKLGIVLHESN